MGLFSTPTERTVFIIDIGSASVGASVVLLRKNSTPNILLSKRVDIEFQSDLRFDRFLSVMLTKVELLCQEFSKSTRGIKEINVFLASPWYTSQTRSISKLEDEPFLVSRKFLEEFVEREVSEFEKKQEEKYHHFQNDAPVIVEHKVMRVLLNGYEVQDIQKKEVKEFSIDLYVSMTPERIMSMITERIQKHFSRTIHFHSFPYAVYSVIRDFFAKDEDFLFLDVTGEVTDVAWVREGVLREVASFPLGKNHVFRLLAARLKVSPGEAGSLFHLYSEDKLEKRKTGEIEEVLHDAQREWLDQLRLVMEEFTSDARVSKTVFFTADEDVSWWFERAIPSRNGIRLPEGEPTIKFISRNFMSHFCVFDMDVEREAFISVESVFLNKIFRVE